MYQEHRRRFQALLAEQNAAAVIPTAAHKVRNHDCEYRFRPESDFWYLTGFAEPESVLVLVPARAPAKGASQAAGNAAAPSAGQIHAGAGQIHAGGSQGQAAPRSRAILFLRPKDREREIWTGRRLGVELAPERLGVDEARPIEKLWSDLPELLRGVERIVYRMGVEEARDREMAAAIGKLRATAKGMILPPVEILDPAPLLHELRLFKSPAELDVMRRAAAITREAHVAAMEAVRPGVNERAIDALLDATFRRLGANGSAYTNIVAGGANACILHYVENDQPLADGDLVLIDAGSELESYASDVTRTFPVNGRFTGDQRALYEVVLGAQQAAIAHVKPGVTFVSVHEVALRALVAGLVRLGLLQGSVDEAIAQETYRRFYMHRTSHWLGLDVHDCGAYVQGGASRTLAPGMVLTVEPGLYVAEDDTTVDEPWRGIGIRIEDDVLVTPTGHEVLTAGIPKTVEDVEAACGSVLASSRR